MEKGAKAARPTVLAGYGHENDDEDEEGPLNQSGPN